MEYSLSQVTSIADCDALLAKATLERRALSLKKDQINLKYDVSSSTSANIEAELASIDGEINVYQTGYDNAAEGTTAKETMGIKLENVKHRKFLLTQRRKSFGVLSRIEKEYDMFSLNKEIEENDVFVAAIKDRRAHL